MARNIQTDALLRAFFYRAAPTLFQGSNEKFGIEDTPPVLVAASVGDVPALVEGRYYHAIQMLGLTDEVFQVQGALDGVNYSPVSLPVDGAVLQQYLDNLVLGAAGLAIATTTSKVKTTASVSYKIGGALYSKGATDNLFTLTGANVADGQSQKWLLCLDAAGVASVVVGTAGASGSAVLLPPVPANKAVIGVLQVDNASGSPFVPGTTLLGAAGITATLTDGYNPTLTQLLISSNGIVQFVGVFQSIRLHKLSGSGTGASAILMSQR